MRYVSGLHRVEPVSRSDEALASTDPAAGYWDMRTFPFLAAAGLVSRLAAQPSPAPARADFVALTRARIAADFKADRAALDSLLSEHLTYGRSSGVLDDKKAVLAEVGPGGPYSLDYLTGDSLVARRFGAVGVVNGIMNVKLKAQPAPYRIRFTDVWAWEDGRWRLVSFQATRLPK